MATRTTSSLGVRGLVLSLLTICLAACASSAQPQVTVSPADHLVDGQSVTIRLSGFGIDTKVWVSECSGATSVQSQGCGAKLAAQTLVVTGMDGTGIGTFTLAGQAQAGPFNSARVEGCSDQCVVVATLGQGRPFASQPITFESP